MLKTKLLFGIFIFSIIPLFSFEHNAVSNSGLVDDVLKYTNEFRRSKKLKALEMRSDLNAIARKHSEDMASGRRSFGHGGFEKRQSQIKKIMKTGCTTAENVAYGARSGKDAFEIWKNSSGHAKNMLGNYRYVGIGTATNKRGVIYYTQILVQ